jgi:hypothetical protein
VLLNKNSDIRITIKIGLIINEIPVRLMPILDNFSSGPDRKTLSIGKLKTMASNKTQNATIISDGRFLFQDKKALSSTRPPKYQSGFELNFMGTAKKR